MTTVDYMLWEKASREMLEVRAIFFKGHPFFSESVVDQNNRLHWMSNVELLQFTGVKDKDGRKIYEGDILDLGYQKAPVIRQYGSFTCGGYYLDDFKGVTVVGDIYQNPELLTEQEDHLFNPSPSEKGV